MLNLAIERNDALRKTEILTIDEGVVKFDYHENCLIFRRFTLSRTHIYTKVNESFSPDQRDRAAATHSTPQNENIE